MAYIDEVKRKVKMLLIEATGIDEDEFDESIDYENTTEWNSRAHMQLMTGIEEVFELTLSPYDILGLNSYKKIVQYILEKVEE